MAFSQREATNYQVRLEGATPSPRDREQARSTRERLMNRSPCGVATKRWDRRFMHPASSHPPGRGFVPGEG